MSIKDIPKNTNDNLQMIDHKTLSSPVPESDIDPIELLETLDGYISLLRGEPSDADIQRILSELQSLVILTMTNDTTQWWMNEPIDLHQHVMKRSMGSRITHLLKSKGEWKGEYRKKDDLEVKARVQLPLRIEIRPEWAEEIKTNEFSILILSIIGLRNAIEMMLEDGATSSGVFRKSDGVIHMNKVKAWLEGNEKRGSWSIKDDLDTMTLFDIIDKTVLKTNL